MLGGAFHYFLNFAQSSHVALVNTLNEVFKYQTLVIKVCYNFLHNKVML